MIIFTDSKSVIDTLQPTNLPDSKTSYLIYEIRKAIYTASEIGITIIIEWIPGHLGIRGNDRADQLAKSALRSNAKTKILLPYTDFYPNILHKTYSIRDRHLQQTGQTKGIHYFQTYFTPGNKKPWYSRSNYSRHIITSICRIRSNHYNMAESLYRIQLTNSPRCSCEQENENIDHILWRCPKYTNQRLNLFQKLSRLNIKLPIPTSSLFKKPSHSSTKLLIIYLKSINIFT